MWDRRSKEPGQAEVRARTHPLSSARCRGGGAGSSGQDRSRGWLGPGKLGPLTLTQPRPTLSEGSLGPAQEPAGWSGDVPPTCAWRGPGFRPLGQSLVGRGKGLPRQHSRHRRQKEGVPRGSPGTLGQKGEPAPRAAGEDRVSRRKCGVRACLTPRSPQKGLVETPKRDGCSEAGAAGAGKDKTKGLGTWGPEIPLPPGAGRGGCAAGGQGSRQSPHLHGCLGSRGTGPPPTGTASRIPGAPVPGAPTRAQEPPRRSPRIPALTALRPRPPRDHFRFCLRGDSNL